jgi:hypothetical protein
MLHPGARADADINHSLVFHSEDKRTILMGQPGVPD